MKKGIPHADRAAPSGPKVLMLMWEIPPLVAGGTWTASYHMVRALRRRGADVTVVVPWDRTSILASPFGDDIDVIPLGITPPQASASSYAGASPLWSSYGTGWSSYGGPALPLWSSYAATASSYSPYGGAALDGAVMFTLIGDFRARLVRYLDTHHADVIHAHDWVTFDAARAAAEHRGIPWIAHVHSTEADRRPGAIDASIEAIERAGLRRAHRVLAPSAVTKSALVAQYGLAQDRIDVVPNPLAEVTVKTPDTTQFDNQRVIFLGRMSRQKGVDRFGALAASVRKDRPGTGFEAFGDGEDRAILDHQGINAHGAIGWNRRATAFAEASVLVVPSRSEPFGMVVLEAMEHGVPVIYPADSGAAEELRSGIKVRTDDIAAMAGEVVQLLDSRAHWENTAQAQTREIRGYPVRGYESRVIATWRDVTARVA